MNLTCVILLSVNLLLGPPSTSAEPLPGEGRRSGAEIVAGALPDGALIRLGTNKFFNGGGVRSISLSPNGKTLATAGQSSVRLTDLETGEERLHIEVPEGPVDKKGAAWRLGKALPDAWPVVPTTSV